MIGMTVTAIRPKGDDDVRAEATKKFHDILDQYFLVDVFERAIGVVETQGMLDAQSLTGTLEFLFAHAAESLTSSRPGASDLTRFTSGRRYDHHLCSMGD